MRGVFGLMEEFKVGGRKHEGGKDWIVDADHLRARENRPGCDPYMVGDWLELVHTSMQKAEDNGRYGGTMPVSKGWVASLG